MVNIIQTIYYWVLEFATYILFPADLILSIFGLFLNFSKINQNNTEPYPIVIFEYWFMRNSWHILMKRYLEKKGFKVYWTNYSLLKGGVEDCADNLDKFVKKNNIENFTLVGISAGAVSAYYYLQTHNGWEKVNKFISVAGPLKGTPGAYLLYFLKGGRQIAPNNDFMLRLLKQHIKNPQKIICARARLDETVPKTSSVLEGTKERIINIVGHNMLHLFSKELFALIAKESHSTT